MSDPYDAGDPAAVNNAERDQARRGRDRAETFRRWMSNPYGRACIMWLLGECKIRGAPFVAGEPDTTAHLLGKQQIGWLIMDEIDRYPELYALMLAEDRQEDQRVAATRAAEARKRDEEEDLGMKFQGHHLTPPKDYFPSKE